MTPLVYFPTSSILVPNDAFDNICSYLRECDKRQALLVSKAWRQRTLHCIKAQEAAKFESAILLLQQSLATPMNTKKYDLKIAAIRRLGSRISETTAPLKNAPDLLILKVQMANLLQTLIDHMAGFGPGTFQNFFKRVAGGTKSRLYCNLIALAELQQKIQAAIPPAVPAQDIAKTLEILLSMGYLEKAIAILQENSNRLSADSHLTFYGFILDEMLARGLFDKAVSYIITLPHHRQPLISRCVRQISHSNYYRKAMKFIPNGMEKLIRLTDEIADPEEKSKRFSDIISILHRPATPRSKELARTLLSRLPIQEQQKASDQLNTPSPDPLPEASIHDRSRIEFATWSLSL